MSIKKGGSKTAMPSGPEQLRLMQLRHPKRQELANVTMALFEKYKEYLLGDYWLWPSLQ